MYSLHDANKNKQLVPFDQLICIVLWYLMCACVLVITCGIEHITYT
jgi:hypothetical protein